MLTQITVYNIHMIVVTMMISSCTAHDEEGEERPAKSARLNTGASPAASDEAGSEGGTPPPGPTHKKSGGPTTKRRSTTVAAQS